MSIVQMSRAMRNLTFCIYENKGADQLRSNCEADQRLCFRYTDSTIPMPSKSKISLLLPSSVIVQIGLCWICPETTLFFLFFFHDTAQMSFIAVKPVLKPLQTTQSSANGDIYAACPRDFFFSVLEVHYKVYLLLYPLFSFGQV